MLAAALFLLVPGVDAQLPAPAISAGSPLVVGGYASVTFVHPEKRSPGSDRDAIQVDELVAALMGWGDLTSRLSYFLELDMAKRTQETWTGREAKESLIPVRLYMEYAASDLLRIRAGRFLTPVGQWNEIHAEPLTWTPMRPLATYRPFAKSLTGLLVGGEGSIHGHDAGYAVFWAPGTDLDRDLESAEESSFARALGGRVAAELRPGLFVGVSGARMRRVRPAYPLEDSLAVGELGELEEDPRDRTLLGADLRWAASRVEVLAEGTWLLPRGDEPREGGAYVLGAVRVTGRLWAVAKGEVYSPVDLRRAHMLYGGVTWRGGRHLVVKLGRQFTNRSSRRIPDGWFLSFSSLF